MFGQLGLDQESPLKRQDLMPEGLEIVARRLGWIARHPRESYRQPGRNRWLRRRDVILIGNCHVAGDYHSGEHFPNGRHDRL